MCEEAELKVCDCDDWTFEQAFKELEQTVDRLESGGLTLDRALEVYEWALELVDWCTVKLDESELRVRRLTAPGDEAGA